jgi:diaminohydroxyphosphoribosylaminopyrimidine deaminase/5-amino-6-(5-phosphoribosylamino)uracil reductase
MISERDQQHMRTALRLAARGRGRVEPNPMVGCVIARGDRVIGQGRHRRFGGPHAEPDAIRRATGTVRGATVYVTLEPCSHHGKTPPCADLLIDRGVGRVVVAMRDPFRDVAGRGIRRLRRAGIAVEVGLLEADARELNAPYLKRIATGRPWVIAKWAMTLDGKIATATGDSKWITSVEARRFAHRVRGRVDAVIVGIGTALADDPELTCRLSRPRRVARRVVLDSRARLPVDSPLVRTARDVPVLVAVSAGAPCKRTHALMEHGCHVVQLPSDRGRVDVGSLLELLGSLEMTNVLVEGGGAVLGSFLDAGEVDEVMAFVGPSIIGGEGKAPVAGTGADKIAEALRIASLSTRRLGDSVLLRGRLS